MANENSTLKYYEQNAAFFASQTVNVEFTQTQDAFLRYLKPGSKILDFGCGAGRDSLYFKNKGYQVEATDGSKELCQLASRLAQIPVRHQLFLELEEVERYDGIWACSSILHLSKTELKQVFERMLRALKADGFIYSSFKYGSLEGYRGDRYFTDFTEESFADFLKTISGIQTIKTWVTEDVRPGRGDEKWLNVILQKSGHQSL